MSRVARLRRQSGILVLDGFRAAPGPMSATAAMMLLTALAAVSYSLGYRFMVDALAHHDTTREAVGAGLVAVLFTLSWALRVTSATQASGVTDRMLVFLTARMATLVNRVPGISHLERPEYLAELEQLDQQRRMLASGPQQALALAQLLVITIGIVALLGTVYLPLALLPLAAVPPFLGDKRSVALRERSDKALAEPRRRAGALFTLASTAAPAKELRVFGLGEELLDRHAKLAAQLRRATIRVAIRGAIWSSLGWIIYALAFAGAIAVIAVRAAGHEASAGDVVLAVSLLRRAQLSVSQVSDTIGKLLTSARAARHLIWLEDYAESEHQHATGQPAPARLHTQASRDAATTAGAITLLISHRFSTVRMADLILVLDNGRVVEQGDHATLIADDGLYAELYELQARAYRG